MTSILLTGAGSSSSSGASTLNNGLQTFFKLDDRFDFFGNSDLTEFNGQTYVTGKIDDGSLHTGPDGTGPYLATAETAPLLLPITGGNVSIGLWVKENSSPGGQVAFMAGKGGANTGNTQYGLSYDSSANIRFEWRSTASINLARPLSTSIRDGFFHFVGGDRDSADVGRCFIDSLASRITTNGSTPGGMANNGADFTIGGDRQSIGGAMTKHMDGVIDAVGIWDRVLTDAEWNELINGGVGLEPPF